MPSPHIKSTRELEKEVVRLEGVIAELTQEVGRLKALEQVCYKLYQSGQRRAEDIGVGGILELLDPFFFGPTKLDESSRT